MIGRDSESAVPVRDGMASDSTAAIRAVKLDTLTFRAFGKRKRKLSFSDTGGLSGGSPDNRQRLRLGCRFVYGINEGQRYAIVRGSLTAGRSTVLCSV